MQVSSGNEKDVYMAERLEEGATSSSCRLIAPGADGGRRQRAFIDAIAFVSVSPLTTTVSGEGSASDAVRTAVGGWASRTRRRRPAAGDGSIETNPSDSSPEAHK